MSQKKLLITQSNYIPWKGYFDLIRSVDDFVVYDDMQYTRRDWRNRNKIKTPTGTIWLTIPVQVKGKFEQKIRETKVSDLDWGKQHWKSIEQYYSRAPYFRAYAEKFAEIYLHKQFEYLTDINVTFIELVCEILGIQTRIHSSSSFNLVEDRTERLVSICRALEGNVYVTGPAARAYMDESKFHEANIQLEYFNYSGYPPYPQLYGEFSHEVSIVDLIFNTGPDALKYLTKSSGKES